MTLTQLQSSCLYFFSYTTFGFCSLFAVETKVGDVHTEHMSTGTGKNPQVSGKYSLHSTNNHNVYVTLKELKKKFDKKIHVVKAGGTLMAGTTPVIKTSKSLLNHFGNFLLFYLTLSIKFCPLSLGLIPRADVARDTFDYEL